MAVHPHVRGADGRHVVYLCLGVGSSPRAWGRRRYHRRRLSRRRFIPTCVGQTVCGRDARAAAAVHPHVRGADLLNAGLKAAAGGSSPRAWGRPQTQAQRLTPLRFIPTCVGQTADAGAAFDAAAVHPHVRGADMYRKRNRLYGRGSSPRAWGRHGLSSRGPSFGRFIPTCVGQTRSSEASRDVESVHPHVRGADGRLCPHHEDPAGSSPRAWGRLGRSPQSRGWFRFIPTCVGQTLARRFKCSLDSGSSPRAWGRRLPKECR